MNVTKKRKVSHNAPVREKRPRQEPDTESRSTTPSEATPEQEQEQNGGAEETNDDAPKTFKDLVRNP